MAKVSLSLVSVLALTSGACSSPADGSTAVSAGELEVASSRATHPVPPISWAPCGGPFECGTAQVPLDYDEPDGPTITIALARLPATDPGRRIGTLFLNPGGPGDSGVDFTMQHGPYLYTDEVRARFDLVGFDPRGQGRSTPLRCFRTAAELGPAFHVPPYPNGAAERRAWIAADRYLDAGCDEHGGRIGEHMSTANVARDLDRLRQAVGDPLLTYNGYSSGTYIGATYANLFPGKVRAMILDGVLDPRAWSTGTGKEGERVPASTRTRAALGALATLQEFFRLCDEGGPRCAFSGDSARRFAALVDRLGVQPVVVPLPDGSFVEVNDTFLIAITREAMSDSLGAWPTLAEQLAGLEALAGLGAPGMATASASGALPSLQLAAAARDGRGGGQEPYPNDLEGRYGMVCVDTVNPRSYAAWQRAAAADGLFGPYWTWFSSRCAEWPFEDDDRYLGPFDARTANPVLVVGNLFDPATRYEGAVALARTLRASTLLTVHGWGHSSHGWGPTPLGISSCADEVGARYLVDLTLPAPGTVCEQDVVPFAGP